MTSSSSVNTSQAAENSATTHPAGRVASLMGDVLCRPFAVSDDFFEAGGDSLTALALAVRLEAAFGVAVGESVVFDHPTASALSDYLHGLQANSAESAPGERVPADPSKSNLDDGSWFSISLPQSLLTIRLDATEADAVDPSFTISTVTRLLGDLSDSALKVSLEELVQRHDMLRAEFGRSSSGVIQRVRSFTDIDVTVGVFDAHDLREAREISRAASWEPFNLEREALIRASLVRFGTHESLLTLTMHHWASDLVTFDVLHRELSEAYGFAVRGEPVRLPAAPIAYRDYVDLEAASIKSATESGRLGESCEFWRQRAREADPTPLVKRVRRARDRQGVGDVTSTITGTSSAARLQTTELRRFCGRQRISPFLACVSAWACVAHEATGARRVPVIVVTGTRRIPGTEATVGFFVEPCLLVADVDPEKTFASVVQTTRRRWFDALGHRTAPFATMLELVPEIIDAFAGPDRGVVTIQWASEPVQLSLQGTEPLVDPSGNVLGEHSGEPVDLHVTFHPRGNEVLCTASYDMRMWEESDIQELVDATGEMLALGVHRRDVPVGHLASALTAIGSGDSR